MKFVWDPEKAEANLRKHGISFSEATEVFDDPNSLDKFDAVHSIDEPRFNTVGMTKKGVLFVVYTEELADFTRIISSRKASSYEKRQYFG